MTLDSSILIYGHDPVLLDTRRWVLEGTGYKVVTASQMEVAREALRSGGIALCILCHTLTPEERRAALAAAAAREPEIKTLSFCPTRSSPGEEEMFGETIGVFHGGAGLIAAIRKLLR